MNTHKPIKNVYLRICIKFYISQAEFLDKHVAFPKKWPSDLILPLNCPSLNL